MRNNDINDEDFGKEIPDDNKQPMEFPWFFQLFGAVVVACVASIIVALTLRLDRWLLR